MRTTYRDIMKARSVSPQKLSQAALSYSMGEVCSLFTSHDPAASAEDNWATFELLRRRLARMNVGFSRLHARIPGNGGAVVPFVCAGLLSEDELLGLLDHYGQKTAVRLAEGKLLGLESDNGGRRWRVLNHRGLDAGLVTAHFGRHFGPGIYFDYPAQGFMQAVAEMTVVQGLPVWRRDPGQ